jgi:hypothetical protein
MVCMHVNRDTQTAWPSLRRLVRLTGLDMRTVRTALEVLEASAVFVRVEHDRDSTTYRAGWEISGSFSPVDVTRVNVDPELCKQFRVGYDRVFRVAVTAVVAGTKDVSRLCRITGLASRQVRQALQAAGSLHTPTVLTIKRTPVRRRDPRTEPVPTPRDQCLQSPTDSSGAKSPKRDIPEETDRKGHPVNPNDMFSAGINRNASEFGDDDQRKPKTKSASRNAKPLSEWTPMESAQEFRDRFRKKYPMLPGETGNVVQIAKILGAWRKKYNHDARVEMETLDLWLLDDADVKRRRDIPAFKKWLASFVRFRPEVDTRLARKDPSYAPPEELVTEAPAEVVTSDWQKNAVAAFQAEQKRKREAMSA